MSKPLPPRPSDERSPLLPLLDDDPDPSSLVLFRRAVGINVRVSTHHDDDGGGGGGDALESARSPAPLGIYAAAIAAHRRFRALRVAATVAVYACHAAHLVVGAALTSLGPSAGAHRVSITALGAVNTVVAGLLTWAKGRGLPDALRRREAELRRVRDWIEETEALLALGVVGRTRDEVGALVAEAFARWHLASEQRGEDGKLEAAAYRGGEEEDDDDDDKGAKGKGLTARWLRGR
ncbi:hypothetical protein LX32DRAFT_695210 [Colletotrichum zoysiae]|uniref:SMODS and SLOG-associating 2TM effector domain-containing protein n=1 Tax=Colletotrichum zoysiae TaxID=1216348 RepID=A0AAD9M2K7_9PEZI|nr:hypothetical protein LX32DRAFT_695210 [Colletotrichum zoysiae]